MRQEWVGRSLESAYRYPDDLVLYGCGMVVYVALYLVVKKWAGNAIIAKFSRNKSSDIPMKKFSRALWKTFAYSVLVAWGVFSTWGEGWVWSPIGITMTWENNKTPWRINAYYVLETVYYTGSFVTMFLEEKQSDFYLMIWHHFETLVLMGFSYHYNFLRYGAYLMLLHDISDPWMDSAKLAVYMGYQGVGDCLFVVFTLMFIVPRIAIYPFMVLIPGYGFLWEFGNKLLVPIWGLLVGVFLLNAYWAVLILRMLADFLTKGRVERDIRDLPEAERQKAQKGKSKEMSRKKNK
ncbi:ceramide synthetase [Nematocida displodere]|uniref:Ceramide synthetase n=1 Tax=Nematocida displodere TaxID=1805483 RepID=A0A177EBT7_9MICR|nr:ceramide synthetase [Nematocida displodere]